MKRLIIALLIAALPAPAAAFPLDAISAIGREAIGQYQSGPMTIPGTCTPVVGTTAKTIAELCGLNGTSVAATQAGVANFTVANPSTTTIVCLGNSSVDTNVTGHDAGTAALNHCWPICDPTTGTDCVGKVMPVRGDIHSWYLRAIATPQKVYILFGSTP